MLGFVVFNHRNNFMSQKHTNDTGLRTLAKLCLRSMGSGIRARVSSLRSQEIWYLLLPSRDMTEILLKGCQILKTIPTKTQLTKLKSNFPGQQPTITCIDNTLFDVFIAVNVKVLPRSAPCSGMLDL